MPRPHLDQATLKTLLRYSRKTGIFTWRVRSDVRPQWNGRYAGKVAGFPWNPDRGKNTYTSIRVFDWPFLAHQLAVLYVTGKWPKHHVDHRDLNGQNNRWRNLREATSSENGLNRGANKNNKTGFKGVSKITKNGRYRATLQVDGHWELIGTYDTAKQASAAYKIAVKIRAGKFARVA